MENSMEDPEKIKNRTTMWSTNPTPGHISRDNSSFWKDACTPVYTTALFTIAETWKQPKCPSTDEWMKKTWYIYTVEYYSTIKNEIMPTAATRMDREIITLNEVSQRMTNTVWYRICVKSKIWQKWASLWNRDGLTDTENTLMVTKGEKGWGRDRLRVWD